MIFAGAGFVGVTQSPRSSHTSAKRSTAHTAADRGPSSAQKTSQEESFVSASETTRHADGRLIRSIAMQQVCGIIVSGFVFSLLSVLESMAWYRYRPWQCVKHS